MICIRKTKFTSEKDLLRSRNGAGKSIGWSHIDAFTGLQFEIPWVIEN